MYLLVIYFPFINFVLAVLCGRFIGFRGCGLISILCMLLTFLISLFIFYEVGLANSICTIKLFPWIDSEFCYIEWGFLFDSLTSIMLLVVNGVSLLVHLFSLSYMKEDPHAIRFMGYLSLFTFFMLMLITSDNFAQMFLGWEGVGLASYLLINFWFTRYQANKSSLKAIILNRFGDFSLVLGLATLFSIFKTFDYDIIFICLPYFRDHLTVFFGYEINSLYLASVFLFIGAVGKSAQLGLHVWLPDAMEGPTPVSALIHAATMVTAGVFLLLRCSPLLEYSKDFLSIIAIIGAITAFFAATAGLVQNDIKKVIAYSTCSQLGYMVFSCGVSNYAGSLFHLMNHAFFKALLFLGAGVIIHALQDEQDMRKMGGLYKLVPFTYSLFLLGSLSLMGFPFLTGFYSKDFIIEYSYASYTVPGYFSFWLGSISAFLTAFYSFRLLWLTFYEKPNGFKKYYENIHDVDYFMGIPLILLGFGSIFIGWLFKDCIIGVGSPFWSNALFIRFDSASILLAEYIPIYIKILPVCLSLLGMFLSLLFYNFCKDILSKIYQDSSMYEIYIFLNKKWCFDIIYYNFITRLSFFLGYEVTFKLIDRGIIELFGPLGCVRLFHGLSKRVNNLNTGYIHNYGFFFIFSAIIFISIILIDAGFIKISLEPSLLMMIIITVFCLFYIKSGLPLIRKKMKL